MGKRLYYEMESNLFTKSIKFLNPISHFEVQIDCDSESQFRPIALRPYGKIKYANEKTKEPNVSWFWSRYKRVDKLSDIMNSIDDFLPLTWYKRQIPPGKLSLIKMITLLEIMAFLR